MRSRPWPTWDARPRRRRARRPSRPSGPAGAATAPGLDSAGLEPALRQQLAKLAERTGWKTEVAWLLQERLDRDLETVVFRVAQEALANAARHADATTVWLRAERDGPDVVLEVVDDGVGFDPPAARERAAATGHLGLRSMAERIQTAGGSLEVSSAPGRGTRVVLRLAA